jgi:Fur family transcriptional regulator, ferric uptake regulator
LRDRQAIYAYIRQHGFRLTSQRQVILEAVLEGEEHSTIEEVYQRACRRAPTLNLATVYRSLNFLCELRLLVAADIGGGRWVFEPAGDTPHHHLVCRTCGKVERIEQAEVQALVDSMDAGHEFHIDMGHIAFFGLCKACQH